MESDEIVIWMEDHSFNLNRAPTKAKKDLRTKGEYRYFLRATKGRCISTGEEVKGLSVDRLTSFQSKKPLPYGYHEQFRQKIIAERIDFLENLGNNWETIKNEADETLDWMDAHPFNLEDEKAQEWDENDHYCRKWTLFDPKPKTTNRGVWIKWEYRYFLERHEIKIHVHRSAHLGRGLRRRHDVNIAKTKIEEFKSVATHPGGSKARRGLTLLQEHLQKLYEWIDQARAARQVWRKQGNIVPRFQVSHSHSRSTPTLAPRSLILLARIVLSCMIHQSRQSRAEKGKHVMEGPNTKKSATHTSHEDDDEEDEKKEDAVTLFQEQGHHPLNIVFDYEAFAFSCIIGHYNILAPFNDYYEEAIAVPYDHNTFQDFL
ncbi:hypothetical protein BGX23_009220, partial [Mortierella sp. AD031]